MSEQRKGTADRAAVVTGALLLGLAAGLIVLLAAGLVVSFMTARGWMGLDGLGGATLVSLFLAALLSGLLTARKMGHKPLLWSLCAGLLLLAVCLGIGVVGFGSVSTPTLVCRLAAALVGAVCAGILLALRRR